MSRSSSSIWRAIESRCDSNAPASACRLSISSCNSRVETRESALGRPGRLPATAAPSDDSAPARLRLFFLLAMLIFFRKLQIRTQPTPGRVEQ